MSVNKDQVNVVASSFIKPEFVKEFEKIAEELVLGTRKEPGCISYVLNKDTSIPNKYYFIESYKNMEAFEYHKSTSHFLNFINHVQDKSESLVIDIMNPII